MFERGVQFENIVPKPKREEEKYLDKNERKKKRERARRKVETVSKVV